MRRRLLHPLIRYAGRPLLASGFADRLEWLELGAMEIEDRFAEGSFEAAVSCLAFSELSPDERRYVLRVALRLLRRVRDYAEIKAQGIDLEMPPVKVENLVRDGDTIRISGKPDLEVTLHGTNGDLATVAIAVNAVQRVVQAAPGLVTMRDLPVVTVS